MKRILHMLCIKKADLKNGRGTADCHFVTQPLMISILLFSPI